MTIEEIKKLDQAYYMNTFGERIPLCFDHGEGIRLFDCSGREYYDFFAGIAVNALGYGNREFSDSLCAYLQNHIPHTSNLYYVETQAKLAEKLIQCSCADRIFFANSGAEANEGAVKLARIYQYKKNRPQKYKIITLVNSFHGRTMATVAATGQEKYQKPYRPLTPGFVHIPINDIRRSEAGTGWNRMCCYGRTDPGGKRRISRWRIILQKRFGSCAVTTVFC